LKIAYLVLAHNRPRQLARLVRALGPEAPIFIHFDKRADDALFDEARKSVLRHSPANFVRRHRCWWGAPGIMRGTLELVAALCESGREFDYATLLSGQDYPIKSHAAIEQTLSAGGEFVECFSMLEPNRWSDHGGYFRSPDRVLGRYVRFRSHVRRIGSRRLPGDITPFGGSQWWTLSRKALQYIDRTRREDHRLIRALATSFIPDEAFVQTILGNSPFASKIVQDDLRFAIWDRPEPPYPATLRQADLPLLAGSDKHFARKFDFEDDWALADEIDALCRGKING